ncbi:MAG: 7-cyano-7-deazaguanine synthase QueC [Nitrospirae bacterium]|nr:7-cyano-7-deazaguanine synthase QueC [Nitrospirota bacterium]
MMKKAVVLLSGGIDSATTLAMAKAEGLETYAMSFDYKQRHKRELDSAKLIAESLGVKKHLIIKIDLRGIGGSALTSDIEVPKAGIRGLGLGVSKEKPITNPQSPIPVTYVPARNTIFLSFALAWAEVLKAEDIFIGANAVDYSGYPDCRPEFIRSFEAMANLATKAGVEGKMRFRVNTPLINLTKAEIIKKGIELGVDYSLTWSCYDPQISNEGEVTSNIEDSNKPIVTSNKLKDKDSSLVTRHSLLPCGRCDSCIFRAKGFKEAGANDPLIFARIQ